MHFSWFAFHKKTQMSFRRATFQQCRWHNKALLHSWTPVFSMYCLFTVKVCDISARLSEDCFPSILDTKLTYFCKTGLQRVLPGRVRWKTAVSYTPLKSKPSPFFVWSGHCRRYYWKFRLTARENSNRQSFPRNSGWYSSFTLQHDKHHLHSGQEYKRSREYSSLNVKRQPHDSSVLPSCLVPA